MLSINNFFGVDLERMPNHKSKFKKTDINIQGKKTKEYSHRISSNSEDCFFKSLEVIVFESKATNFIFKKIPYNRENAVDIAFIIERDLFNNGKLGYDSYLKKNRKKFDDIYFRFEWKIEKATIYFERWDDELSLTVFSQFYHDRDNEVVVPDSMVAEDGIVEYKFGSDLYPQGCEVKPGEQYYQEPLPIEDYTYRTIKVRVKATDERLSEYAKLWQKSFNNEDVGFMGLIMDEACVFVSPETHIVLPMTQAIDRKNLVLGHKIYAYIKRINSINMDVYFEYILQIMTEKEIDDSYIISKETIFENQEIPSYIYELNEHYKPKKQTDIPEQKDEKTKKIVTDKTRMKTKTISISFNEYDLQSSKKEYLKRCADGNEIELKLSLMKDKRKREYIAVESVNSDYPLSTEIKDDCFIEDFKKHEQLVKEGKTTDKCYGVLFHYQDANSEFSTSQRIFFHIKIYMPWTIYKEVPIAPQKIQETPCLETECDGEQEYIANLVGFKFCLKEDELEEVDKYFYEFENNIYLRPEIDNPFDTNAIAAYLENGKKIAYVAKENAQLLRPLLKENGELIAKPERFNFTSGTVRLSLPCNRSLELVGLFSQYKPIEVYKAHYLNVYWGGSDSLVERRIFDAKEQIINFKELLSLHIKQQNYLANEWKDNMGKASVENPTNLGLRMSVHLELSIYGTNYNDIDLSDIELLDKIEEDNKKTALFVRLSREGYVTTPEEFIKKYCSDACDTLRKRLEYEFDKSKK